MVFPTMTISTVDEDALRDLLPLLRSYCSFYGCQPSDESLLFLARKLISNPEHEGVQLLARRGSVAVGFATVFWSWSTLRAARIGIMNDLYVSHEARGSGVAERLIAACLELCRLRGAVNLQWQTKPDNYRAQRVYERVGGSRSEWLDYWLPA